MTTDSNTNTNINPIDPLRNLELEAMRRMMDHVHRERLEHLEVKLSEIDEWVRKELHGIDTRIDERFKQCERIMLTDYAHFAVKLAFSYMGVNVDDPKDLETLRKNLRFNDTVRHGIVKGFLALMAAIFGGIGLSIWLAFKDRFGWK